MRDKIPPISNYNVGNVFQITSEVTQALHNLEEMDMDQFEFRSERPTNMLTLPLEIDSVYVAPLRLVTGLITRLDENWPPLVSSYKMLVNNFQVNQLDDLHYFIEFCWLAWGPSVLTTSLLEQNNKFMVVQAAFGDEANSIPLIMKKKIWRKIENKLKKRDYGWPLSLKNVLVVRPGSDPFFKELKNEGHLFKDIFFDNELSDTNQIALYLPFEDKEFADGEFNTAIETMKACYSTAYVWLMLEQISQEEMALENVRHKTMKPGRIIPFFEHANLGTNKGLNFLQHCLARKAIYHVLDCESDPEYSENGYYCFATALFPKETVEIIENEIRRLNTKDQKILRKRLKIPEEKFWRTPQEVVKFADAVGEAINDYCLELVVKSEDCKLCDKYETCEERKNKELSLENAEISI